LIDIYISPTSLDRMQLCWRLYHYVSKRKLIPFYRPPRMEKGSVGHKVLAYYYKEVGYNTVREVKKGRDKIVEEAMNLFTLEVANSEIAGDKTSVDILNETLNSYFRHYAHEDWIPLLDDKGEPLVEVPLTKVIFEREDTAEEDGIRIIFNGIIDLILAARKGVGVTIVDHKFPSRKTEFYSLANQLALYSAVTGIQNVLRNDAGSQKESNVNKFSRPGFRYDQAQMKENLQWAIYWAQEAHYHEMIEVFPPNPSSCDKYGGCQMLGVCSTTPGAREAVINASFKVGRKFSIYEKEAIGDTATVVSADTEQPVVEVGTPQASSADEGQESVSPVPSVREASGTLDHGGQEEGEQRGLDTVPLPQEGTETREPLRDGEGTTPESSVQVETLADRLLNEALRK
jgi:hypothetical protein